MKSGRPRLLQNLFLNSFLALCCGVFPAPPSWAGGGSYNGPALSGPSIPVNTDRFPSFADLQSTVGYCLAGLGETLWQQAYRQRPNAGASKRIDFSYLPDHCDYTAGVSWVDAGAAFLQSSSSASRNILISDSVCSPHFLLELALPSLPIRIPRMPGLANPEGMTTVESFEFLDQAGLPQVRFDESIENGAYDEFGRIANFDAVKLHQISIQLPAEHGPAVPLRNRTTGRKTSLTANVQRYAECLQSRLQQ